MAFYYYPCSFRWDYYEQSKSDLKGFRNFLKDGCQVEYVDPGFPSLSYPAWTTIRLAFRFTTAIVGQNIHFHSEIDQAFCLSSIRSTGLYAESHGILGNNFLDLKQGAAFGIGGDSTKSEMWWQDAEPIWITATRNNQKSFLHLWSRCDVPFKGLLPRRCTGYGSCILTDTNTKTHKKSF